MVRGHKRGMKLGDRGRAPLPRVVVWVFVLVWSARSEKVVVAYRGSATKVPIFPESAEAMPLSRKGLGKLGFRRNPDGRVAGALAPGVRGSGARRLRIGGHQRFAAE
jgi:hypothetical protein